MKPISHTIKHATGCVLVTALMLMPWVIQAQTLEDSSPAEFETSQTLNNNTPPETAVETDTATPAPFVIKDIETMVEGALSKKKISGAIIGTTISAALSAHPAGAFLGGLIGALVGKESKYIKVESPPLATSDDLFADLDKLNAETRDAIMPPEAAPAIVQENAPKIQTASHTCAGRDTTQTRSRVSLRSCFYHMH